MKKVSLRVMMNALSKPRAYIWRTIHLGPVHPQFLLTHEDWDFLSSAYVAAFLDITADDPLPLKEGLSRNFGGRQHSFTFVDLKKVGAYVFDQIMSHAPSAGCKTCEIKFLMADQRSFDIDLNYDSIRLCKINCGSACQKDSPKLGN